MTILVVGAGGREHALAWACHRDRPAATILCAPGNGGTAAIAENVAVAADDAAGLVRLAVDRGVDLAVLGPDAAIAAGVGDAFADAGISCFGPTRAAGMIEASKRAAKQIMDAAAVPTARWLAGDSTDRAALLGFVDELGGRCVVKADGLALGKGVTVCDTAAEAAAALDACLLEGRFGAAGSAVVVEERLEGRELSILALTDSEHLHLLPAARDYKRAHDGDAGPNTGGMGAESPAPGLGDADFLDVVRDTVLRPTVDALRDRGTPFRGCLYAGLMVGADGVVRVLEFNARFGDPEAQVVLPRLTGDVVELLGACARGGLPEGRAVPREGAAVGVVAASAGYPGPVAPGAPISGLDGAEADGVHVFHGGTRRDPGGRLTTSAGRVITVVAQGRDREAARRRAYQHLDGISFEGMWHRRDIASGANGSTR